MAEKRSYPRFELELEAKYKIMTYAEAFKLSRTKNISAEGICFESDNKLNSGIHVKLEVDLKDGSKPVYLAGEVRWSSSKENSENKKYLNGVRLVNISKTDEGRFLQYYCYRMVEKLGDYLKI